MPTSDRPPRAGRPLRELFPILDQGHYLNHAAIAPWPLPVAEAVRQFAEENLRRGPRDYSAWIRREQSLRGQLAELAGAASPEDITLLKNTTEGISLVAWGLDWRAGDNLVLPRGEFASNRLPWLAQAGRGVVVREVDIRGTDTRNGRDPEAALIAAMDRGTRLLSVSAVQWSDGFRLDLGRLGEACHERGVLFFVDAIQQLGELRLSVEDCRVGDTIVLEKFQDGAIPLPGYKEIKPVVYASFYPKEGDDYNFMRDALGKLKLNDAAFAFEPEANLALGRGFRCG